MAKVILNRGEKHGQAMGNNSSRENLFSLQDQRRDFSPKFHRVSTLGLLAVPAPSGHAVHPGPVIASSGPAYTIPAVAPPFCSLG